MQLRLPWLTRPPAPPRTRAPRTVTVADRAFPVEIVRHARARRFVIRLSCEGVLRLTVPRGAAIGDGLQFAQRQAAWIAGEADRQRAHRAPWGTGTAVWFRGDRVTIAYDGCAVSLGSALTIPVAPSDDLRGAVETHLRSLATDELPSRCRDLAAQCGLEVSRITVRNQRSRWGACSGRRAITLNWRLIQAPPAVSDYVLLHELMHLRQPNHSPRFWREVASVCPAWREAERWLRKFGKELL